MYKESHPCLFIPSDFITSGFAPLNGTVRDGGGGGSDDDDNKSNITQHSDVKKLSLHVLFIRFSEKTSNRVCYKDESLQHLLSNF
jgi:hypothetical protein